MSDTLEELPAHAPLGPSSAEGWATCADYVNANRGLPDVTIEPAAEGTAAHSISDTAIATGMAAAEFIGTVTKVADYTFTWTEEDAMLMQPGLDFVSSAVTRQVFGEHRVDISEWTVPGQFGTLDTAWFDDEWITIRDLKWGRGIAVSPVRSKQLMLYALGFWWAVARHYTKATRFRLVIDQPRHAGGGGIWETTLDELLAFGEWIKERAILTQDPHASRTASLAGCMWCRARRTKRGCDTYDQYMIDLLGLSWDSIDMGLLMGDEFTPPRDLTPERRSYLLLHKDAIKRWLEQLHDETMQDALDGKPTGEIKAVPGRKAADYYKDHARAERYLPKILGPSAWKKFLKTPTQAGKEVEGKAARILGRLVSRGGRSPVLVPLADARSAITAAQSKLDEEL